MNNKELEQIGESVWDTYKKLATCLVERSQGPLIGKKTERRKRALEQLAAADQGNPTTAKIT